MGLERRYPLWLIAEVARGNKIIANQSLFDFVDPNQAPKFVGFVSLALSNNHTVGFKEAQDLIRMVTTSATIGGLVSTLLTPEKSAPDNVPDGSASVPGQDVRASQGNLADGCRR